MASASCPYDTGDLLFFEDIMLDNLAQDAKQHYMGADHRLWFVSPFADPNADFRWTGFPGRMRKQLGLVIRRRRTIEGWLLLLYLTHGDVSYVVCWPYDSMHRRELSGGVRRLRGYDER